MSTPTRTTLTNDIATSIAVAVSYFAMCWFGLSLGVTAGVGSVWPASGLLTGILLLASRDSWVAIGAGAFIGGVAANLGVGFDSVTSIGYVLINLGESFVANWLVRRYAPDAMRLRQPSDLFVLVGCCALVAVSAGAPIAAALASLTAHAHFWTALRTWWTADVCGVILVAPVVVTAVDSAQRSARLHRDLALTLQSAVEAERARLAHELHDDIAQKLAALKMQLELDQLLGQNRRTDTDAVGVLDSLIGDVRELSRSLRPAPFVEGQLIPALATLAKTEGRRAGLRVLVDTPADEVPLSRECELACYRVVREAVINIVKHARAHHLAVSALKHADCFSVRVVDDGTGFDVAPSARQAVLDGHLGLMGMQERLEQVGGTLKIQSRRGGGTMVECRVPLTATI